MFIKQLRIFVIIDGLFLSLRRFSKIARRYFLIYLDEIEEKIHLDVQKLMIMKQKGIKIDSTSERNLKKKWEGLDFTIFDN